jgi:hypothetical protein
MDNVAACTSDTFTPIVLEEVFEKRITCEVSTDHNYSDP